MVENGNGAGVCVKMFPDFTPWYSSAQLYHRVQQDDLVLKQQLYQYEAYLSSEEELDVWLT